MKNLRIQHTAILLLLLLIASCSNDDSTPTADDEPNASNVADFIASISSDGSTFWPTATRLNNEGATDLDISSQFVATDDELLFSLTTNNRVQLQWYPSYKINAEATTDAEVATDELELSRTWLLDETESGFLYEDDQFRFDATVTEELTLAVTLQLKSTEAELSWQLEPKPAAAYPSAPSNLLSAEQVLYLDAHTPEAGIAYARTTNSIYVYRQAAPMDEAIDRFDLSTSMQTSLAIPNQNSATKSIEFMNGSVFAIGASSVYRFDYDISALLETYDALSLDFGYGTTSVDGHIYSLGGFGSLGESPIANFSLEDPVFTPIVEMSQPKWYADGVVYQDKMYVFGGYAFQGGDFEISNEINIYSLPGFEGQNVPFNDVSFRHTSVARDQHLFYVGGREITEIIDNGGGSSTLITESHIGVYNAMTGVYSSFDIAGLIPATEKIFNIAVGDGQLFVATSGPSESSSFFGIRVYKIEL